MTRTTFKAAGVMVLGAASLWQSTLARVVADESDAQVLQALQAAAPRRYAEQAREPIAWTKKSIIEATQLAIRHPSFVQPPAAQPIATVMPTTTAPITQTSAVRAAPPRRVESSAPVQKELRSVPSVQLGTAPREIPPSASNTPAFIAAGELKPVAVSAEAATQRLPAVNPIRGGASPVTNSGNPLR